MGASQRERARTAAGAVCLEGSPTSLLAQIPGATSLPIGLALCALVAGCTVTPNPITDQERTIRVDSDMSQMFVGQETLHGPVDLYEAVARGLKYNLDKRLKLMELGLSDSKLRYAHVDLLPKLAANAGYRKRDPARGSSSRSLLTGRQSLEVSTSEDPRLRTTDLHVVWNVLDFGLSYLRVKQDADRVLIAEERRMKVAQNMVMDIRAAYWRAVAAQRMLPRVNGLVGRIRVAIARSRNLARSGDSEPADELQLQRALISHLKDLMEVRRRLSLAKSELAALINLPPGTVYLLAMPANTGLTIPNIRANIRELERTALLNRPELREEDYNKRISIHEVDAAYVRILPGIELRAGVSYDSNSFLFKSNWTDAATLVTKNLLELATARYAIDFAEKSVQVADARRLALSMAIVAQVNIALQRFALSRDVFRVSNSLFQVDRNLSYIAARGAESTALSDVEALEAFSRKIVSELQYYSSYSDVQNSYARILNSIGAHRFPAEIEDYSVAELRDYLRQYLDNWHSPQNLMQLAMN